MDKPPIDKVDNGDYVIIGPEGDVASLGLGASPTPHGKLDPSLQLQEAWAFASTMLGPLTDESGNLLTLDSAIAQNGIIIGGPREPVTTSVKTWGETMQTARALELKHQGVVAHNQRLMDYIIQLEAGIRREADYCYQHQAACEATGEQERAERHMERGDRLMALLQETLA